MELMELEWRENEMKERFPIRFRHGLPPGAHPPQPTTDNNNSADSMQSNHLSVSGSMDIESFRVRWELFFGTESVGNIAMRRAALASSNAPWPWT
jgi:hypothetical protein